MEDKSYKIYEDFFKRQAILEIGIAIGQRQTLFEIQNIALRNNGVVKLSDLKDISEQCSINESNKEVSKYESEFHKKIRLTSLDITKGR